MHLKRLQLTGFKTFADKTEILFSPGVTAIVGPNGSGKSNIADAVLWVLGEQKASAVRGVRNQDVIFNGSARRKQTGLAEVSLTVDNADGILPLSYDEVTVTRRALRSGDSEYFINKSACRLKDIYELFLDTGVGREAYALVNQSEIDAVLTAAPESRRGLFEEAAGIKKYRVKKREALRKLEATELNLSRITDILSEIESQLAPLHLQAEIARRYLTFKEQLTRIEEDYLITELRKADEQWQLARLGRESDEILAEQYVEQIAQSEAIYESAAATLEIAERELDAYRAAHQQLHANNDRLHNEKHLTEERIQALTVQAELHHRELQELLPRLAETTARVATLSTEAEQAGQQSGERERQQSDGEDQLRRLNQQIAKLQATSDRRRKEAETLARRRTSEEAELARAEARLSELQSNVALQQEERSSFAAEKAGVLAAEKEAIAACDAAEDALAAATDSTSKLRENKASEVEKSAQARLEHETVRGEGLSLSVRLRSLQGLEDSQEGYFAGVKAVLAAVKGGRLSGRYTVVADAFQAPEHLVTALDTAFGSSLQDIITDTEDEAKSAIELLKRGSLGRATFLPLRRMRGGRSDLRLPRGYSSQGVLGPALELITFDEDVRPALDALIGRVLICETLEDGIELSKTATGWSRIVTVAGEVLVPSGAITGGSNQRRGGSLLERKTEIARLSAQLVEQKQAEDRAATRLKFAINNLARSEEQLNEAGERFAELRLKSSAARQLLDRAKRDYQSVTDRADAHDRRLQTALETLRIASERVETCRQLLGQLSEPTDDGPAGDEAEQLRLLQLERETISAQITQERIGRAALEEKSAGLSRALRLARAEAEQMAVQQERRIQQIAQVASDHMTLLERLHTMSANIIESDEATAAADRKLLQLNENRQSLATNAASAAATIRDLHNSRSIAVAAARKNELAEARYEIMRQQAAMKLLEEYDVTAEFALAMETAPSVTTDGPREVARLRRELKALGDVNVAAVEEFERLSERFAHMTAQKNDAQAAKDKIYEAIREIDESTRDVFMGTFHAVEAAFQVVFQQLFNGGSSSLKLTDPDDLLETGIDILVQLPGKKQQNLQLLSGGERALTAVALLFAFLKVRPAPFCLLDEVDAPLDGANIERFADLLREFGQSTQFLVITHNPATMEAAHVWYGVTMQEPGVSRVLSLQVPEPLVQTEETREIVFN